VPWVVQPTVRAPDAPRALPTAIPDQLKFKLGQAGEHTGRHAAGGVARVDALEQ
jgi:hypothetical protein